jgi:DNA polymerase
MQVAPAIVVNKDIRVKADGPKTAKVVFVGMAPAKEEVVAGKPFVGAAGRIFNDALHSLGYKRADVYVTNMVEFPILVGHSVHSLTPELLQPELDRLAREIEEVNPNIIVPLGDDPLRAITDRHSISRWRGSIIPANARFGHRKVMPTVHPAWILRGSWKWLPIFKHVDLRRAMTEAAYPEIRLPERRAIINPGLSQVLQYLEHLETQPYVSVDIETMGLTTITCVGLGASADEAITIPFTRPGSAAPFWSPEEEAIVWRRVARLLENPAVGKIAQNASFDFSFFWQLGIYPYPLSYDTMTQHHCLYPDFGATGDDAFGAKRPGGSDPGHGLAFIVSQYTRQPYYKDDGRMWLPVYGPEQFWRYNALDVMCTYEVCMKMKQELYNERLNDYYDSTYIRPFYSALAAEWTGIRIDETARASALAATRTECAALRALINDIVGYELNVRSAAQMKKFLYEERGYQERRSKKTGQVTVDKETLRHFAQKKGDKVLEHILKLRDLEDLVSDILDVPLTDGRIRTHYRFGGTDGARWSSGRSVLGPSTNLQNVRRAGIARSLFLPD